ncbi:hypothetical protein QQP08_003048, partial [Theobroma cacao]
MEIKKQSTTTESVATSSHHGAGLLSELARQRNLLGKKRNQIGNEALPPFPTSQNPNLATRVPAHNASAQPHQYVTPSTPQTGSVRKQLTGHDAGFVNRVQTPSFSWALVNPSEGNRIDPELSCSDWAIGAEKQKSRRTN